MKLSSKARSNIGVALIGIAILGALASGWASGRDNIIVSLRYQPPAQDLTKEVQKVSNLVSSQFAGAQLRQVTKVEVAYIVVWGDAQNNYSGVFLDDSLLTVSQTPLNVPPAAAPPTPTPTPTP